MKANGKMNIFTRMFHIGVGTINGLAALLLIASAYSDRVAPETSMLFSYLGLAFPLICLLNLFFMLYWLFLRKFKYLLIGFLAFLLCLNPLSSYFPIHSRKDVPRGDVIKVLTYNVMGFAYAKHTEEKPNKIVDYIVHSDADIVCMQEFFTYRSGDNLTLSRLEKALDMYPYHAVVRLKKFDWGLAVFSKYPILSSRRIDYDSDDNGSSIHRIDVNGKVLTLINNHLESFKLTSEDRSRYSDFIKGAGADTFDDLLRGTIQKKLGSAFLIRSVQARQIAKEISETQDKYLLVCGDFNDTPISYAHRTVQGPLLDAFAESGRGQGRTYNQNYFWFRIDHILYSANMEAFNCTVDHVKYSDHYPVWCYLKLN